jgi:hypothetical protein
MNHYIEEMAECRRRIALGKSLNALLTINPDFKLVVLEGYLKDEILRRSLNINADKSGTVSFIKGVAHFNDYLKRVQLESDQAVIDLANYQNLISQPQ